jgi:DNA-binding XRE family transcriptional regulator
MENIIYGLRDPRNDVYQYIGKSTVGSKRVLSHLTQSHSDRVNEWVKTLNENWLYPIVDLIEEVENVDDLPEREKYWINHYYDINHNLLNVQLIDPSLNKIRTDDDEEEFNYLVRVISKLPTILKNERLCRKLSQEQMADEMGISRSTLSLAERGENVNFSVIRKYVRTLKGIDILTKSLTERVTRKNI